MSTGFYGFYGTTFADVLTHPEDMPKEDDAADPESPNPEATSGGPNDPGAGEDDLALPSVS